MTSYDDPRNHHIVCECFSDEHTLRFSHFKANPGTDDFKELYWSIYLNPYPWHKRLWVAVRYVFGPTGHGSGIGIAARQWTQMQWIGCVGFWSG